MKHRDPNIVNSGLSRTVTIDGEKLEVVIHRLEHDAQWTLQVVNSVGTSTVWDMSFDTDEEASEAFDLTLAEEGVEAFFDRTNVIQFPSKH